MLRFPLLPDRSGYSVKPLRDNVIENALIGGMDASRVDVIGDAFSISMTVTLDPRRFELVREFLNAYAANPVLFEILLITTPISAANHLRMHLAQIVPGSLQLGKIEGHHYELSMDLEAFINDLIPISLLYPLMFGEELNVDVPEATKGLLEVAPMGSDHLSIQTIATSGALLSLLLTYNDAAIESLTVGIPAATAGDLRNLLVSYFNWPTEGLTVETSTPTSGDLRNLLVRYLNWPEESLSISTVPTTGELS